MMKALSLSKPLLLVTVGPPGVGKSTFAKQFAATYGFAHVHGNRLRSILTDRPSFNSEENRVVSQLGRHLLSELLQTKANIIFDETADSQAQRIELVTEARKAGYRVLLVWVQTDAATAQVRAVKRSSRPPTDPFAAPLTTTIFARLAKQFERPTDKEVYVVISGKHPFAPQAQALLRRIALLDKPRAVAASASTSTTGSAGANASTSSASRSKDPKPTKNGKEVRRVAINPSGPLPSVPQMHRAQAASDRTRLRFDDSRPIKVR